MSRVDTGLSVLRTILTARLAPTLLLVFCVVWPSAGFPWWPIVLVLVLGVVLRILGFGYLIAGRRGPVLLVGLLLATTLLAWSPWLCATAVGIAVAVAGLFRLPRPRLLAVGVVLALGAGSGAVAETMTEAQRSAEAYEYNRDHHRALVLPRRPREMLGAVMGTVADADTVAACGLFTDAAEKQLAAVFEVVDCPAAILEWHTAVVRPDAYDLSNRLHGDTFTTSPDRRTATVTACDLTWIDPIRGTEPPAGPRSPGRMRLHLLAGTGYEITDYQPC